MWSVITTYKVQHILLLWYFNKTCLSNVDSNFVYLEPCCRCPFKNIIIHVVIYYTQYVWIWTISWPDRPLTYINSRRLLFLLAMGQQASSSVHPWFLCRTLCHWYSNLKFCPQLIKSFPMVSYRTLKLNFSYVKVDKDDVLITWCQPFLAILKQVCHSKNNKFTMSVFTLYMKVIFVWDIILWHSSVLYEQYEVGFRWSWPEVTMRSAMPINTQFGASSYLHVSWFPGRKNRFEKSSVHVLWPVLSVSSWEK